MESLPFKPSQVNKSNAYKSEKKKKKEKKVAANTIGKKIQIFKIFLNAAKKENINGYEAYKKQ